MECTKFNMACMTSIRFYKNSKVIYTAMYNIHRLEKKIKSEVYNVMSNFH